MKKAITYIFIVLFSLVSCASEKYNTSPIANSISGSTISNKTIDELATNSINNNINASEITNLISSFPKINNNAVNDEISVLKINLQNYLYAYEAYNIDGKNRALSSIEKSYRKIQKLKNFLNTDEREVVNRYLVRIKTNISVLESSTVPSH